MNLKLRLVIEVLRTTLPVEVGVEIGIDTPRDQFRFCIWLGVVANEPVWVVGVGSTVETDVRDKVTRAADHRKLMSEVTTALVVIDRIRKTVLLTVANISLFRKKEKMTTVRAQYLPAKRCLLVETEATVEAAEIVVLIDEAVMGSQKTDERI